MEHKTAMALASAIVMVGGSGAVAVGTLTGVVGPDPGDVPAVPKADLRPIEVDGPGPAAGKKPPVERVTRYVDVPVPAPAPAAPAPAPVAPVAPPSALAQPAPVGAVTGGAVDDHGAEDAAEALGEQREERAEALEEQREERAEALEERREERRDRLEDLRDDSDGSGSGSGGGDGGSGHG
jgi:hypothetical protein